MKIKGRKALLGALLTGLTLAAFSPVVRNGFILIDDPDYIRGNPHISTGLTWENVSWAMTTFHSTNWHPLTWLSHLVDVQLFGLNAGGHHLVSLLFHAANGLLLFLVLARMTGSVGRSALAAALFALHPLRVESVAWAAERKDVLSACFWMLTMAAWLGYVRRPAWGRYAAVCLLLALGLAAKPMLVTLPLVLLLLDRWPLGRWGAAPGALRGSIFPGRGAILWEKLPLLALSAASSLVTLAAQRQAVVGKWTAHGSVFTANALSAYAVYIGKTLWPAGLAFFYPFQESVPRGLLVGALILLALGTLLAVRRARTAPAILTGWGWYLVTLVPVIGLVKVGAQWLADRYTYIPTVGLSLALLWALPGPSSPRARRAAFACAVLTIAVLAALTFRQASFWHDDGTLFSHAAAVTERNYLAEDKLGSHLAGRGKMAEAMGHFARAIEYRPGYADAWNNMGAALAQLGRFDEAKGPYVEALRLDPDQPEAHYNLAVILLREGDKASAEQHLRRALELKPGFPAARQALASISGG